MLGVIAMNISDNEFIEVPQPLFKYEGGKVVHEDNLSILSVYDQPVILDKNEVEAVRSELKYLHERLQAKNVPDYVKQLTEYKQTARSLIIDFDTLQGALNLLSQCYEETGDQYLIPIMLLSRAIKKALSPIASDLKTMREAIQTTKRIIDLFRDDLIRYQDLKQKLTSHYAGVEDQRKTEILRKSMAEEANIVMDQIRSTLARLGFAHTYTKGKKTLTDYVKFDYVVATPDQLQLKILASKRGLWGGSVDMLPQGVYVTDILKPRVMDELSTALEREVWSPHTSEDKITLINGAWVIVERLGLVEGIPKNVTYDQLMARYDTADHGKIPIPAGLKRGRRVNWVHLDSPSGIHLMFTGISGSGKSNAMRANISAVIEKQDPIDVNFVFIDLKKQGDFREFEHAPHCISHEGKGVLTDINQVVSVLQRVQAEMHMRQNTIGKIANNLIDYNKRVSPDHRMPRIIIVFDEYANTRRSRFSEQADIIDDICIEIGQVGRASGISLWLGIQQPRRDNMPSALRDNITTQFVGHQNNVGAGMSATGNRDSLKLEDIPGRMSASVGWKTDKVQMPFISEDIVKRAVQIARDKFGDDNPYNLVASEDVDKVHKTTDEEIVIRTAFESFAGNLKIRPIWEELNGQISLNKVTDIVREIASNETIEYLGEDYTIEKQSGNYYAFVPVTNEVEQNIPA